MKGGKRGKDLLGKTNIDAKKEGISVVRRGDGDVIKDQSANLKGIDYLRLMNLNKRDSDFGSLSRLFALLIWMNINSTD